MKPGMNDPAHCAHTWLIWKDRKAVCSACDTLFDGIYNPTLVGHFERIRYERWVNEIQSRGVATTMTLSRAQRVMLDDDGFVRMIGGAQ